MNNVIRLSDYQGPPTQSQYERYQLPFFNSDALCTWDVKPSGDYGRDCETGNAYAIEFLRNCDSTVGWSGLLSQIAADMIRAGPSGVFADGHPRINGVVVGFMGAIGRALAEAAPVTRGHKPGPSA